MASSKRKKKILYTILVAVIIVALLVVVAVNTSAERENISKPEKIIREILAPFQNGASIISDNFAVIPEYLSGMNGLMQENDQLKQEISELQNQIVSAEETQSENQRLKDLLNFAKENMSDYQYSTTNVINRSQSNWYSTMIINGGENMGFEIDMPVVANGGLVGRIINVTSNTSEVMLILDQDGAVGGMIQETRAIGIVEGSGNDSKQMQMIHLPYDSAIQKYDRVITSGLGGIYPKGLLIGYIKDWEVDAGGTTITALVESFVDFDKLEEVMVVTKTATGDAEADKRTEGE
ncbi:MAG: rod shape-determining protein MreC [Bacillota bacterium]